MTTAPESGPQPCTAPTARHRTRFFDHRIPSLYAGRYEIGNRQVLKDVDEGADREIVATPQPFDVIEPRFSIDPAGINARFPVPDAVGTYSEILPHINLDAPGLPWNRPLVPGASEEEREAQRAVPWMALLLFRENELPEDPDAVGLVKAGTVRGLLTRGLGAGEPPDLPELSMRPEEYDEHCATVLVPADLFDKVKPLPVEMGYLAHVREGGPPDATLSDGDPEPDEGQLNGVVVANRFPAAAGGRHVVHLVSLEGFDRYLAEPAPSQGVRLVSLTSWAFTTNADSGIGFGDLAQQLATTDGETPRSADGLRLRLPVSAPTNPDAEEREVLDRMEGGAVALPQRLETGERTAAFHRGPLTARPARALPAPAAPRLKSPGEALIYLEKYGVFDTSYGAAFTAGRTLALSDAEFRTALLEFRSTARSAVRRLASHPQLQLGTRAVTARQLTAPLSFEAFDRMLLDGDGDRFTRAVVPRPPVPGGPAPRPMCGHCCPSQVSPASSPRPPRASSGPSPTGSTGCDGWRCWASSTWSRTAGCCPRRASASPTSMPAGSAPPWTGHSASASATPWTPTSTTWPPPADAYRPARYCSAPIWYRTGPRPSSPPTRVPVSWSRCAAPSSAPMSASCSTRG
ncbi:hypothetical protein [Streptomyces nigrescens]